MLLFAVEQDWTLKNILAVVVQRIYVCELKEEEGGMRNDYERAT